MKLFGGLTFVAGLASAACPADWTDDSGSCEPSGNFAFTCNDDGTVDITASMSHFFDAVPTNLASSLAADLVSDGWSNANNVFTRKATLSMSQSSVSTITGTYTLAGTQSWAQHTLGAGSEVIDIARALSYDITCNYDTQFSISVGNVGIEAVENFSADSASNTNTLVTAQLQDSSSTVAASWVLGDQVNVVFTGPTWAKLSVEKCIAYSNSGYTNDAVTITHGDCKQTALNAVVTSDTDFSDLVTSISFDAFKYNANDETAYLKCDVLLGLTTGSGGSLALDNDFAGEIATINTAGASADSNSLSCPP